MKGDFSRLTGLNAKRKHYNGVLKQQGRVQLDSDWNELISIISHQRKIRTIDTIGHCGAPIHNSGYQILHPGGGFADLLIATGRFYAGGLLCETTPSSKLPINEITGTEDILVDDTKIDGIEIEVGHWVQIKTDEDPIGVIGQITSVTFGELRIGSDISSLVGDLHPYLRRLVLYSEQSDFPGSGAYQVVSGQTDLLYLDVWERHITPIEDGLLREVALGGPDTDTRSKVIAQVKTLTDVGNVNCEDEIDDWHNLKKLPNGRMTTRLVVPADPIDPCQLGESGGFLGLENHLYRVEIHEVSGGATFKWSSNNAAYAYAIKEFFEDAPGNVVKINLQQNGKDDILKIKQQDWIEVSGDETDLNSGTAGTLVKVLEVDGTWLTLDTNVFAHIGEGSTKVRRWDISNQRPDVTTAIVSGTGFQLEDGIEIEFSGSDFNVGAYWVFSARTLTGEIEILDREAPLGIKHHYCKLGLVTGLPDGNVEIEDCRPEFPPLTELPDTGGCCTVTVGENEEFQDIQLAINSLNGGPGEVCIKPGVYEIDKPIEVEGKDITIRGCEGTPIIINNSDKPDLGIIFRIKDSWDIMIHDLWCFSKAGDRVVEVENCLFFNIYNCTLVGAGSGDLAGIVTCQGLTVNTSIDNNIILGTIGIRYDGIKEQDLGIHLNARMKENIIFVLDSGLVEDSEVGIIGLDLVDNLIMGLNKETLSKSFFPESLFKAAEEINLFEEEEIEEAKNSRNEGKEFESLSKRNPQAANDLYYEMKTKGNEAKTYAYATNEIVIRTLKPLVELSGFVVDANVIDNILLGNTAVVSENAMEFTIDNNTIVVELLGIVTGNLEGVTIENNIIISKGSGIACTKENLVGLTISNNRLACDVNGIQFVGSDEDNYQVALNVQIDKNIIVAKSIGISINNIAILLMDLTIVDNSILNCETTGIILRATSLFDGAFDDYVSFQRVIQRNSILTRRTGIDVQISNCKILDNDINVIQENRGVFLDSIGIILRSDEATISNNTIHAEVNDENGLAPLGGVQIATDLGTGRDKSHNIHIVNNKIKEGVGNGIEIMSYVNGLVIEENEIVGMGLNGIAVGADISQVDNLQIKNNIIQYCHQSIGKQLDWWVYAGIVLTATRQTQITGNVVSNNGVVQTTDNLLEVGALYAEEINEIIISENQFMNNGISGQNNNQSVIHVPIKQVAQSGVQTNSEIQIINNIVKSFHSPTLTLGSFSIIDGTAVAVDHKAVISNNQFNSTSSNCIVFLYVSQCIFSGNLVANGTSGASVSFGFGVDVLVNGNMISAPVVATGQNQMLVNNLELS